MVPACDPFTFTAVSVPLEMVTATTVPVLFVAVTPVFGTDGVLTVGADKLNCHSHREQRNVSAATGWKRDWNQQRGHVSLASSAGWSSAGV